MGDFKQGFRVEMREIKFVKTEGLLKGTLDTVVMAHTIGVPWVVVRGRSARERGVLKELLHS